MHIEVIKYYSVSVDQKPRMVRVIDYICVSEPNHSLEMHGMLVLSFISTWTYLLQRQYLEYMFCKGGNCITFQKHKVLFCTLVLN